MKQEREKIRFAVAGCGHIGKRHAEMITRNPEAELVAMADIKPRSELKLSAFDHVPFYENLEEMLEYAGDEIDVVTIATPNGLHASQALRALSRGKHVVIEKPIALNRNDAEKILFKALKMDRQVFSVMQNRYSPPSIWLKELVESGVLGKIFMVQINCFWNRDERYYTPESWHGCGKMDGGTLYTQFSHFIDIMFWLFGDIKDVQSRFTSNNHSHLTDFEDSGMVNFQFLNGGMGALNFTTSVWDKNLESSMTIIAENGSIKVGGQYMNEVEYCHVRGYQMPELAPTNPANDYGAYKGSAANHHYIIQNVVNVLKGKDSITTNALEGLKVVEIIDKVYQAGQPTIKAPEIYPVNDVFQNLVNDIQRH
ncbi:MAG: oxidoreductase, partial [Sphingobacteriales bacterium 12-47-4]